MKYRVEQHDPNSWHEDGSPCIIGSGYEGDDLRAALINAQCLNMLQGEGKPRYAVATDEPLDADGRQPVLDQAIQSEGEAIDEEVIFDTLVADHDQSPAQAAELLGWPKPYEQYA